MAKLTDVLARALSRSEKPICDDAVSGLYLFPASAKVKGKWIFRYVSPLTRKRRDMGLGTYPTVGIRDARLKAIELRGQIDDGGDPLEARRMSDEEQRLKLAMPTFEEAARDVHRSLSAGFRNANHIDQWINTLDDYVFPKIGRVPVAELKPAHFADVLRPIWLTKPETASRVRQRCDAVMKCAPRKGSSWPAPWPSYRSFSLNNQVSASWSSITRQCVGATFPRSISSFSAREPHRGARCLSSLSSPPLVRGKFAA